MNESEKIENRIYEVKEIADIWGMKYDTLRQILNRKLKANICYVEKYKQKFIIAKTSSRINLIPVDVIPASNIQLSKFCWGKSEQPMINALESYQKYLCPDCSKELDRNLKNYKNEYLI